MSENDAHPISGCAFLLANENHIEGRNAIEPTEKQAVRNGIKQILQNEGLCVKLMFKTGLH